MNLIANSLSPVSAVLPILSERRMAERLAESSIFRIYQRAFTGGCGLPLFLQVAPGQTSEAIRVAQSPNIHPFCQLARSPLGSCVGCGLNGLPPLQSVATGTLRAACPTGMNVAAVPVRVGEIVIAWLVTGQVAFEDLTKAHFDQVREPLSANGVEFTAAMQDALASAPRMAKREFQDAIGLLEIIATFLGGEMNALILQHDGIGSLGAALHDPAQGDCGNSVGAAEDPGQRAPEIRERMGLERVRHELLADLHHELKDETMARLSGCRNVKVFNDQFMFYFHESSESYGRRMRKCHRQIETWRPAS
jgi:hypothetical protein